MKSVDLINVDFATLLFFVCILKDSVGRGSCTSALLSILWPPASLVLPLEQAKQRSLRLVVSVSFRPNTPHLFKYVKA